jgi:ferredoxin
MAWMESMKQGFLAEGVEASSVHYESFGGHAAEESSAKGKSTPDDANASGHGAVPATAAFSVKFETSQLETTFDGSQPDLLTHAKANDVDIPFGCRMGNCGSCTVKLLKGTVDYKHPPASSLAADAILPCVCLPTSDLVVQA